MNNLSFIPKHRIKELVRLQRNVVWERRAVAVVIDIAYRIGSRTFCRAGPACSTCSNRSRSTRRGAARRLFHEKLSIFKLPCSLEIRVLNSIGANRQPDKYADLFRFSYTPFGPRLTVFDASVCVDVCVCGCVCVSKATLSGGTTEKQSAGRKHNERTKMNIERSKRYPAMRTKPDDDFTD